MDMIAERVEDRAECRRRASLIAARIRHLAEPYRENTISWMEKCAARSLEELDRDLASFLSELGTVERELYVSNLQMILDDALRYFGKPLSG